VEYDEGYIVRPRKMERDRERERDEKIYFN
jgi:hypothetical protein